VNFTQLQRQNLPNKITVKISDVRVFISSAQTLPCTWTCIHFLCTNSSMYMNVYSFPLHKLFHVHVRVFISSAQTVGPLIQLVLFLLRSVEYRSDDIFSQFHKSWHKLSKLFLHTSEIGQLIQLVSSVADTNDLLPISWQNWFPCHKPFLLRSVVDFKVFYTVARRQVHHDF
jgi:hypothetical protein